MAGAVLGRAADAAAPNILWLTCEDIGPHLGAYGDKYADTPVLDKLASRGMIYRNAWSNAPVCAPARTTIISGVFPPSTGSEHMRSMTRLAPSMKMFPCYLREAGYYTSNNSKEDYNVEKTGTVWDESSTKAHWRKRSSGQPFLSVFNFGITHESQIRTRPHKWVHDISKAPLPAYHPDTQEVREDWAQYYDNITTMDDMAGDILKQLEEDGLADSTIVFFYGDHGSGMPRNKRWPYNSGLQVPFIVHFPEKFKHLAPTDYKPGGSSDRPIGFIDLAPTVLSLAGIRPPDFMQGSAFAGSHKAAARQYNFGFRGRMDERYDLVRSVRDGRYVYVRNYMPHKAYGQHIAYMFETPTTRVWKRLYDEGKLQTSQKAFWEKKPAEELYDLQKDRDEIHNLVNSPEHQKVLTRLRKAQRDQVLSIRDIGFLPEGEIHERAHGSSPYDAAQDNTKYPLQRILDTAELASSLESGGTEQLTRRLSDPDSAVRYWAVLGFTIRQQAAPEKMLDDASAYVRVAAAESLGCYGNSAQAKRALDVLLELADADTYGVYLCLAALNAIESMGKRAAASKAAIAQLDVKDPKAPQNMAENPQRLKDYILLSL